MKLLYIYGWKSNVESETYKRLKYLLPEHEIICVEYDQKNPLKARNFFNQYIIDNEINGVIASSFGAFIALNIQHSVWKFLINPCFFPSIEIPRFEKVDDDFINDCLYLELTQLEPDDEDMRFTVAFFNKNDKLFSYLYHACNNSCYQNHDG